MDELQSYEKLIKSEGVHHAFPKYAGKQNCVYLLEILCGFTFSLTLKFSRTEARSDCSSFKHKGDLGEFGRGDMQKVCSFL